MNQLSNPEVRSISAFFPCYNDEHTIARVVRTAHTTLKNLGVDFEIIVIDDGSKDNSVEVLRALLDELEELEIVEHHTNKGYGGALRSGLTCATKEWIFYTDGDAQYDPSELESLVKLASNDVDVVQGYKMFRSDSIKRKVIGRFYHHTVRFLFGLKVRDVDCDFRLIRRSAMTNIRLVNDSGVICLELVRKLQQSGARFVQTPVHHYARLHGRSQFFRPKRIARSLADMGVLWINLVVLRKGNKYPDRVIDIRDSVVDATEKAVDSNVS